MLIIDMFLLTYYIDLYNLFKARLDTNVFNASVFFGYICIGGSIGWLEAYNLGQHKLGFLVLYPSLLFRFGCGIYIFCTNNLPYMI